MWAGYRSAPNECAPTAPASKQTARSQFRWPLGMHTLIGLFVAAAAACVIARPPGPTSQPEPPVLPPRSFLRNYAIPQFLPNYFGYDDSFKAEQEPDDHAWLNKEIDRLNRMDDDEEYFTPLDIESFLRLRSRWPIQESYIEPIKPQELPVYLPKSTDAEEDQFLTSKHIDIPKPILNEPMPENHLSTDISIEKKDTFAMTPLETGYFAPEDKVIIQQPYGPHEGGELKLIEMEPLRQIRQKPNFSKTRNLVAENLDRLRIGLANKDYRMPVSLLPSNLRWLKINHPTDLSSTNEAPTVTDRPRHIHVMESASDPAESIYGVALIAAVGAALAMAIFAFAFGWYTISKKAKAAADVDYPAYGVTGPTIDASGDRKLAHSAHMYHYQHQKQQIIAMERNGLEQRNASVSDPESEEENEEGDYTVYECPGFATTGEMEVKNPLFSEDPTPATPGKCEIVKPQPKD